MTAPTDSTPATPTAPAAPTLEFSQLAPTPENIQAIVSIAGVEARVRFTVTAEFTEHYLPSSRHRKTQSRTVNTPLDLTVRLVPRERAPIALTVRRDGSALETYRLFEGRLFKLELNDPRGVDRRPLSLEDVQRLAQWAARGYGANLETVRSRAEEVVNERILVSGLVYALADEPVYTTHYRDVLTVTDDPPGLHHPEAMTGVFNALEREAALETIRSGISKCRRRHLGGAGANIKVYRPEAVHRPTNALQRQAVEGATVERTLKLVRDAFKRHDATREVRARVLETLNAELTAELEAEQARRIPVKTTVVLSPEQPVTLEQEIEAGDVLETALNTVQAFTVPEEDDSQYDRDERDDADDWDEVEAEGWQDAA